MKIFIVNQIKDVSFFGNGLVVPIVILAVYFLYFWVKKYRKDAILLMITPFSYVYTSALKLIFHEQRPSLIGVPVRTIADIYSFPSGHVVFYVSFFGFLLYMALTSKKLNLWLRIFTGIVSTYLIMLVGASRVLLGVHWIHDVIAGYFFGLIYLGFMIYLDQRLVKERWYSMTEGQNKNDQGRNGGDQNKTR